MPSGSLGLGSRARSGTSSHKRPAENSTALVRSQTPAPAKRRGFGLFDSDFDSEMSEAEAPKAPKTEPRPTVRFSGDTSGFAAVRSYDAFSSGEESAQRRTTNSRRSKHTTPSKSRSSRPTRRATPYSGTTARALSRARREQERQSTDDELMNRPIDSPFDDEEEKRKSPRRSKSRTPTKFRMSGARPGREQLDLSEEEALADISTPAQQTPRKNLFAGQNGASTLPRAARKSPKEEKPAQTPTKTWAEWAKSILPIPTPAKKFFGTPAKKAKSPQIFRTPEQNDADKSFEIPGSFEKASQPYVNPNILEVANSPEHKSPAPSNSSKTELFTYNTTPGPNWRELQKLRGSRTTNNTPAKGLGEPEHNTPQRSIPALSGATSMRKTSNFIQRLKAAKGSSRRYDPYARPSKIPKKKLPAAESKSLTAEEQLELLEQRERDRKVQEAEDRYMRRQALRDLGREADITDDEGDRSMVDAGVATSPVKKPRVSFGLPPNLSPSSDEEEPAQSTTPPNTPPRQPTFRVRSPEKLTPPSVPLFQPTPPPKKTASTATTTTSPPGTLTPPTSFDSDNDDQLSAEENISPPPAPSMSHRELPAQPTTAAPPPPSTSLFGDKPQPIGGFGLAPPAPPSPANMARFQKHKPRIGSSLRNEAQAENFDDFAKENAAGAQTSASPSGSGVKGKAFGQTATTGPSRGALGEMGSNSLSQGIKVDLRARVASLPVSDLASLISWPTVSASANGAFNYDASVVAGIKDTWTPSMMEEYGKSIFSDAMAVKV